MCAESETWCVCGDRAKVSVPSVAELGVSCLERRGGCKLSKFQYRSLMMRGYNVVLSRLTGSNSHEFTRALTAHIAL